MMTNTDITKHKAYIYALEASKDKHNNVPKYVKKQAKEWLKIANSKDKKYTINLKKLQNIEGILSLLVMPKGLNAKKPIKDCLAGFQYFFIVAILCTVHRDDPSKRKYQNVVLEIGRKNGKTLLIAILFLILLLTEPKFSDFFSVGADGSISRLVKTMMENIIDISPEISKRKIFKVTKDYILCNLTQNKYTPLNYKNGRFDGREPSAFLTDECGALPNAEAINSMRMGQQHIKNKLGVIISTKYPEINNPFDNEVNYCKNVLDKIVDDDTLFALLYEPDNIEEKDWIKGNKTIFQANPLSVELKPILKTIQDERKKAIMDKTFTGTYLCKQLNIQCALQAQETFVDLKQLRKGKVSTIDFKDKDIYVGVDLALSTDNTAITAAYIKDNIIYTYTMIFLPAGRIEMKTQGEKVDYQYYIDNNMCKACGGLKMDYSVIQQFIVDLPKMLGCNRIKQIGFDPAQAQSMMNFFSNKGYDVVEIRQNAATLNGTIQYLRDKILDEQFKYQANDLYEINFNNAKVNFDGGNRMYFEKQKCRGRIDALMSTVDAVYLIFQSELGNDDYIASPSILV